MIVVIKMTLKELRISKKLTQSQVSDFFGVSLRSYKQYENDEKKKNTLKYKFMCEELEKIGYIDEEHGILSLEDIKEKISTVFSNYQVHYCYLFGSYAKGLQNEKSDIDLLISSDVTGMDFYGLAEELRETLHKKVDLLNVQQLSNNQVLLEEILKDGIKIYG